MTRILVVKFWALGDILMATPILRGLKNLYKECEIDWLVDTYYSGAVDGNPLISEVIQFDSGSWRKDYRYGRWITYISKSLSIRKFLSGRNYDIVIVLTPDKWWASWFAVGVTNVGLFPSHKPGLLSKFYDVVIPVPSSGYIHNSIHYLEVVRALGGTGDLDTRMVCCSTPADRETVDLFLSDNGLHPGEKPIVILHPGTSQISKCWPMENFVHLIEELGEDFAYVVTGSATERLLATLVKESAPATATILIASGQLCQLGETIALIERSNIVVTGDTSILHIASALEVPTVAIYGSTRPGTNEPLHGTNVLLYDDTVECAPCNQAECRFKDLRRLRCQLAISPSTVAQSIMGLLATSNEVLRSYSCKGKN
jgi:ADP-heptose:LPS heptosyltransferase